MNDLDRSVQQFHDAIAHVVKPKFDAAPSGNPRRWIRCAMLTAILLSSSYCCLADVIPVVPQPKRNTEQKLAVAVQMLQRDRLDDARARLVQDFGTASNQPHPEILLARLLNQLGKEPQARIVLEELALAEPNRVDVCLVFADLALREARWLEGWMHIAAAESAEPSSHWSEEYRSDIQQDLKMLKAACCEGRRQWQLAKEVYETIQPEQAQRPVAVLQGLGRSEFYLKNVKAALQHFTRAWQQDGELKPPELTIATLYNAAGNLNETEAWFRKAMKNSDPSAQAQACIVCGRWLIYQNRPMDAAMALSRPSTDQVLEKERLYLNAMAARMEQRFDESLKILTDLHRQDTTGFAVSNQLALVLIENVDESLRGRALQIAESNVRNHPRTAEAWSTLGWIQFRLGDLAAAQESLSRSFSAATASRDTAWYMAELQQRLGNIEQANQLRDAAKKASGPMFTNMVSSGPPK